MPHGELTGAVDGMVRETDGAEGRADIDDAPAALRQHLRQHGMGKLHGHRGVDVHDLGNASRVLLME